MMPSRGLHAVARARVPRLIHSQCRNLSTTPRPHFRSVSHNTSLLTRTSNPWARSIPATIPSIAAFRYASTAQSQPAAASNSPPATPDTNAFPNLDTITLDDINASASEIANIPEGLGYLKQIGIDYGMGPTSAIEWVLEHFHIWGGLPWWGSIVATAMIIRLVMFPLYLKSSDSMARQTAIASVTKPISDRLAQAQKEGNTQEVMAAFQQMGAIRKRAGIRLSSQFMPLIAQGVLGYCGFKLMRACATLPVPGFHDGGFLWLTDLTMTDGYLILPLLMAGTMHVMFRLGGESGAQSTAAMGAGMKKVMLYGMPGMIFLFTAWQPGAVAVWFAASGIIGITQGQLLQLRAVRDFFGLAPIYKPKPGESAGGLMEGLLNASKPAYPSQSGATGGGGKNSLYMNPTYQSPNLRSASGRTIDTKLTNKTVEPAAAAEDMIQPGQAAQPKKGILDSVTDGPSKWWKENVTARSQPTAAQEKKAFKRKADEYERRAQRRGG